MAKRDDDQMRLFQEKLVPADPATGMLFETEFEGKSSGPVTCLGRTFPSDEARREHFLAELAKKLKDPAFRKIEGFPLGEDEDILALSDPPYYTACPNPWLADFIQHYGHPYTPKEKYHREPFAADVSEGKTHPIYLAHSYHTKVPHRAIMRYILHYTEPGDLVFDSFAGTGMTGVAAQLCGNKEEVQSLGYRVQDDGTILDDKGTPFSKLGTRRAALNDLSPTATFIAHNYNMPADLTVFTREAQLILTEVQNEFGWMYETTHKDGKRKGRINYTVWSDIFTCPECAGEVVFWDEAVTDGKVQADINCPHCQAALTKRSLDRKTVTIFDDCTKKTLTRAKRTPVLINYTVGGDRFEKKPDKDDLAVLARIEKTPCPYWFPTTPLQENSDLWLERDYRSLGIYTVDAFFTKRNLIMVAFCRDAIMRREGRVRTLLWFWFESVLMGFSLVNRYLKNAFSQVNRILSGTLYVGAMQSEVSPWYALSGKLRRLSALSMIAHRNSILETRSAVSFSCPDNSVDYVFIDPPFGSNIIYSDLSFVWEAWLKLSTNLDAEAVVHRRKKEGALSLSGYMGLMRKSFAEMYRVLKPGRWITIEFSNTRSTVWNAIQTALQEAGFVIANVAALDKKMGSFKAVTTPTAVKQDLIISAYKPNGGFEERFKQEALTEEGVWDFVRTHLTYLPVVKTQCGTLQPITERDPRILFDQLVAYYVRRGFPVPMSSHEFQSGLAQRFSERDGMFFLPEQATEYDRKKLQFGNPEDQWGSTVIEDEQSAIGWLMARLKKSPQPYNEIQPDFMPMLSHLKEFERELISLDVLLEQNFLCYDGKGLVPEQIHAHLSTNWKELRKLPKDAPSLVAKARDRWYVPDPNKAGDLEKLREKALLKEFEEYKAAKKKLKVFRLEAVRAGFKALWQQQTPDAYRIIKEVAEKIPCDILEEDPKLLMWYDQAVTRLGGE